MTAIRKIPMMLYRGGTSKGPVFSKGLFPESTAERDRMLLALMGSPVPGPQAAARALRQPEDSCASGVSAGDDARKVAMGMGIVDRPGALQVDGLGGGQSVTSKAILVEASKRRGIDVEYLVCEVAAGAPVVETTIDCGNMLAAVGPWAIERGLVRAQVPSTMVRILSQITGAVTEAEVPTDGAGPDPRREVGAGDGQPRTGMKIRLSVLDPGGTTCGKVLPTGRVVDTIDGIKVSCVDVSMPMVIVDAKSLGKTGYEDKAQLDADHEMMRNLETIRQRAALSMGLGCVIGKVMPKICMVSPPRFGGTLNARYMVAPFNNDTHATMAITGALCLAGAALESGSVANLVSKSQEPAELKTRRINIEHPAGTLPIDVTCDWVAEKLTISRASYTRSARLISSGTVECPALGAEAGFSADSSDSGCSDDDLFTTK